MIFPRRLLYLSQLALASAFSGIAARAKTRGRNVVVQVQVRGAVLDCTKSSSMSCHDNMYLPKSSHIVSIKSSNIAGMINDGDDSCIEVDFGSDACLVAVTGESGSGKSLLVSKAIDLITGGRAVPSLVPPSNGEQASASSVEMTVNLFEPHLSAISTNLERLGIDLRFLPNDNSESRQIQLKRELSAGIAGRLKSFCTVNEIPISLKTLRQIALPLFTRVDVGVASAALGRPASRLAMLDMGVPENLKQNCRELRDNYKDAKKHKEKIKRALESRVLPSSLKGGTKNGGFDEEQIQMLEHWVDELDSFETRIARFQDALLVQYNELISDELDIENGEGSTGLGATLQRLRSKSWEGMQHTEPDDDDSLLTFLLDFREQVKASERKLVAAHSAYESLASLTASNSALVALDNTRKLLFSISSDDGGPLFETIENTHELLNKVEVLLHDCARSIDGDSGSLISMLEKVASTGISVEVVDSIIADWNALARKHGITPESLPNCHMSMREELDGNVEALKLLPEAEERERTSRDDFSQACQALSDARSKVASELSRSVTDLLPSLGLEGTTFHVEMSLRPGGWQHPYYGSESIGVDIADFLLLHRKRNNGNSGSSENAASEDAGLSPHGGSIEQVGSSGEKSRVLLAIETALPGSIGSACNSFGDGTERLPSERSNSAPPISIIYDEIDAHVGGRAAVTMAKLLADQSRTSRSRDNGMPADRGIQIIAITHSASLAAIADRHIVVERCYRSGSQASPVRTYVADGSSRRKEIARMASGDLASDEAETFADALIRDALLQRSISSS